MPEKPSKEYVKAPGSASADTTPEDSLGEPSPEDSFDSEVVQGQVVVAPQPQA